MKAKTWKLVGKWATFIVLSFLLYVSMWEIWQGNYLFIGLGTYAAITVLFNNFKWR